MARLYGWSPRGERSIASIPHGHWKTLTLVMGLRHDGAIAPWIVDGAMTGEAFRVYIESILCPELKAGDIVICDNLACHHVAGVREAIERKGAFLRHLPPYSPDLNPIENAFAKIKSVLRKLGKRTVDALLESVLPALESLSKDDCTGFFRHANYATH